MPQSCLLLRSYRVDGAFLTKLRAAAELDGVVRRELPPINKRLPSEAIGRRQRELMAELPPLTYWARIHADTGNFPCIALPRRCGLRGR
jgi:hypothetical protein